MRIAKLLIQVVFFTLAILLLLSLLSLLGFWGVNAAERPEILREMVVYRLPRSILEALPASVLTALVLLLARNPLRQGRFFSYLLILGAGFALLYLPVAVLTGIAERADRRLASLSPSAERFLVPGVLNPLGDREAVYTAKIADRRLEGIVFVQTGSAEGAFRAYKEGSVQIGKNLTIRLEGEKPRSVAARPVYSRLFQERLFRSDRLLPAFLLDAELLNQELERVAGQSRRDLALLCFSLLFAFSAAGLFMGSGRWPLISLAAGFIFIRLCFLLFRFLRTGLAQEAAKVLSNAFLVRNLPAGVLLVLGAILFMAALLSGAFASSSSRGRLP